jgi:formylglycine-generating enzyme required for sulfatase activity
MPSRYGFFLFASGALSCARGPEQRAPLPDAASVRVTAPHPVTSAIPTPATAEVAPPAPALPESRVVGGPNVFLSVRTSRDGDEYPRWQFVTPGLPAISPKGDSVRVPSRQSTLGDIPNLSLLDVAVAGTNAARTEVVLSVDSVSRASLGSPDQRQAGIEALRREVERRVQEANTAYEREGFRPMWACNVVESPYDTNPGCAMRVQHLDCAGVLLEVERGGVRASGSRTPLVPLGKEPSPTRPDPAPVTRHACIRAASLDAGSRVLAVERVSLCATGGDACDEAARWDTVRLPKGLTVEHRPAPAPSAGSCATDAVAVSSGSFQMGRGDGSSDEKPPHQVTVPAFCMDRTEVTVHAYAACVKRGACTPAGTEAFCTAGEPDGGELPITCVNFAQARRYCEFAHARLPTEEEWEYAARGIEGRLYPWGHDAPAAGVCFQRTFNAGPCAVSAVTSDRTPLGLLHMGGNVYEWTSSQYRADYSSPPETNSRVMRGGCWGEKLPEQVTATIRHRAEPSQQSDVTGFRCAR